MEAIDTLQKDVATLYREWTGRSLPATDPAQPYAPLRPDQDPQAQVIQALQHLTGLVSGQAGTRGASLAWMPPVQIWEADESWRIEIDLPGVQRRQLRLGCRGQNLWLRGERSRTISAGENPRWSECLSGTFERQILIPCPYEPKSITSQFKDGVLKVHIPKGTGTSPAEDTEIELS